MQIYQRQDLARLIKGECAYKGITLDQLGQRLGVLPQSISRTVNRSDISLTQLQSIAAALGTALDIRFTPTDRRTEPTADH